MSDPLRSSKEPIHNLPKVSIALPDATRFEGRHVERRQTVFHLNPSDNPLKKPNHQSSNNRTLGSTVGSNLKHHLPTSTSSIASTYRRNSNNKSNLPMNHNGPNNYPFLGSTSDSCTTCTYSDCCSCSLCRGGGGDPYCDKPCGPPCSQNPGCHTLRDPCRNKLAYLDGHFPNPFKRCGILKPAWLVHCGDVSRIALILS
jgi:hypothetical protein